MILALLLALTLDAPAPTAKKPKPKPTPSPVVVEPIDIEGVQTDPPEPLPSPTPVPLPTPLPSPKPTPIERANARPFRVQTELGALVTMTGDAGTDVTPTFWVNADGPLALGSKSYGRVGARLGLSTSPGQSLALADIRTYRAAEVGLYLGVVVGHYRDVDTTLVVEGDFASRLKGTQDLAPRNRLVRSAGAGIRFDAAKSNASMTLLAGFDEGSATCDPGIVCTGFHSGLAFMLYGQVPIVQGAVLLVGDATLSAGGSVAYFRRRDVLRLGVVVDPVESIKVIRGK